MSIKLFSNFKNKKIRMTLHLLAVDWNLEVLTNSYMRIKIFAVTEGCFRIFKLLFREPAWFFEHWASYTASFLSNIDIYHNDICQSGLQCLRVSGVWCFKPSVLGNEKNLTIKISDKFHDICTVFALLRYLFLKIKTFHKIPFIKFLLFLATKIDLLSDFHPKF